MQSSIYSPSINILRDFNEEFNYIQTANAEQIYHQIISNYQKGSRSFSLIGSYGSGKSSFILALEQSLNGVNSLFEKTKLFSQDKKVEFLNIIGESRSLVDTFAESFNVSKNDITPSQIIKAIEIYYNSTKNSFLLIAIDEFGKFLEFAAKNNPERELYFIQQLAELANSKLKDIIFLTVLHKNFNAYSLNLTKNQLDEWNKVKGRLVELNFNEPVEQLLYLAAEKLKEKRNYKIEIFNVEELHRAILNSQLYPLRGYDSFDFTRKILPFDLLSAAILTLTLQEYAQNERSLFSFIENEEELGILKFNKEASPFYNLACVYDYVLYYHYSFISTKYNPHLNQWNSIRSSLEKVEAIIKDDVNGAAKIIKTIGLLNIFSHKGGSIDKEFLKSYSLLSLGIENPSKLINDLEKSKIIRYSKIDRRYKLLHGTDLDFELAINEAGNLIEKISDVTVYLNRYFDFPVIAAKEVTYKTGTPRMFSFILSEEPVNEIPEGEIDGFINLIFGAKINSSKIKVISASCNEAILYGFYTNTEKIEDTIFEIEKIKKVIEKNENDRVAIRELEDILKHYKSLLNHFVIESLYSGGEAIKWYYKGDLIQIRSLKELNNTLSSICFEIYSDTPIFRNELVNKTKISGSISSARKTLISAALMENYEGILGLNDCRFPPEKTIFLSFLSAAGLWQQNEGKYFLTAPTEPSFIHLWEGCIVFLNSTRNEQKSLTDFNKYLKRRPFKLKQGFIDFWIPLFLIVNKNDTAIFQKDRVSGQLTYIPTLNMEVLELINKSPKDYVIKKFDLTPSKLELFNKYREVLNQIEQNAFTNKSFIETFKPFLVFYKSLSDYAKNTKRITERAQRLRNAIAHATDPEAAFFEEFPKALGYSATELIGDSQAMIEFTFQIKECIQEINESFDHLINEMESYINTEVIGESMEFPANKKVFQKRYENIKVELLQPRQRAFYGRLVSLLDNRKAWINSLTQIILETGLENISDNDIPVLKEKLLDRFRELDNYTELTSHDIDLDKEDVIKLEVTSLLKGLSKKYLRIPKSKFDKIATLEESYKDLLKNNDKSINIALLIRLLQDQLEEDEES